MGILFSKKKSPSENDIDYIRAIAASQIINSDMFDMTKITTDSQYCHKLKNHITDIIIKHMTSEEIITLFKNITNDETLINVDFDENNNILYNNQELCKNIADYFVKIAYIFNSVKKTFLLNDNADINLLNDLCHNREKHIDNFFTDANYSEANINPNLCNIRDKPSIDELKQIYNNSASDKANFDEIDKLVNENNDMIKDCEQESMLRGSNGSTNYLINKTNNVYTKQTNILNDIRKNITATQVLLVNELNKIFIVENKEKHIVKIKTELNLNKLNKIQENVKSIITKLYLGCETNFKEAYHTQKQLLKNVKKMCPESPS